MRIDKESHAEHQTEKNILESARFNLVECPHRNAYRNQVLRLPIDLLNGREMETSRTRF